MLRDAFESPGTLSPEQLRSEYDALLVETIDRVSKERVAEASGVETETLSKLTAGDAPDLTLSEATAILATDENRPDTETLETEARDILLMGMSMAVLDVEALASGINDEMEPKEIQQKVEGRYPISLDEYALLHSYIESKKR